MGPMFSVRVWVFGMTVAIAAPALAGDLTQIPAEAAKGGFNLSDQLIFPPFDPVLGRKLFAEKGCAVCHRMNGIGGDEGPDLTYGEYHTPVNAMEVASDLWEKASIMISEQEEELGAQIELSPEGLAAIIAFMADPAEQKHFSKDDRPADMLKDMEEM